MIRRRSIRASRIKRMLYHVAKGPVYVLNRIFTALTLLNRRKRAALFASLAVAALVGVLLILPKSGQGAGVKKGGPALARIGALPEDGQMLEIVPPKAPLETTPVPSPEPTPDPSLYYGVEDSEAVTELQLRLMELGYLDIDEPTLHFGPATEDAVMRFQRQHELQQDKIAGAQTLALIYSDDAKKYTLLEGTRGTDVDSFQRQLKELGYLRKVTGYYGSETIEAVKAFQKVNGLSVDGKAGEKTFNMINSDKAKQSPELAKQARSRANIKKMIEIAKAQLGAKYIRGNEGPNSYDCSGLVYYCLKQGGSNRRRLNAAGYSNIEDWEKIDSLSKLKAGDLLFFRNNSGSKIGHVGIYIGNGEMVEASSNNGKVVRRSCTSATWKRLFAWARRPW